VSLPEFIRVTMAARLSRLSLDRLRTLADRGHFARRYILGGLDYFKVDEFLDAVVKLPGDPKRLRDERDFLDWQAAGRPVHRRRPASQGSRRGPTSRELPSRAQGGVGMTRKPKPMEADPLCATGCTTPPAYVVAGEAMCWDCADEMGVAS